MMVVLCCVVLCCVVMIVLCCWRKDDTCGTVGVADGKRMILAALLVWLLEKG